MARGPLAGAAGPGKFSKRTDGMQLPSSGYGEGVETAAIKSAVPLSRTESVRGMPASDVRAAASVTPLYAPTERPQEPITTGIDMGLGAGSEAMGLRQTTEEDTNFRATIMEYMPILSYVAQLPNTSPETRKAIRQLRDSL